MKQSPLVVKTTYARSQPFDVQCVDEDASLRSDAATTVRNEIQQIMPKAQLMLGSLNGIEQMHKYTTHLHCCFLFAAEAQVQHLNTSSGGCIWCIHLATHHWQNTQ